MDMFYILTQKVTTYSSIFLCLSLHDVYHQASHVYLVVRVYHGAHVYHVPRAYHVSLSSTVERWETCLENAFFNQDQLNVIQNSDSNIRLYKYKLHTVILPRP